MTVGLRAFLRTEFTKIKRQEQKQNKTQNPKYGQKGPPGASQITKNKKSDLQKGRLIANLSFVALLIAALLEIMFEKSIANMIAKLAHRKEMAQWQVLCAQRVWIERDT